MLARFSIGLLLAGLLVHVCAWLHPSPPLERAWLHPSSSPSLKSVTGTIPLRAAVVLPALPAAPPDPEPAVATDAVLRFGHYSCCAAAGLLAVSSSLQLGCLTSAALLAAGEWLYGGRMLLTGSLLVNSGGELWSTLRDGTGALELWRVLGSSGALEQKRSSSPALGTQTSHSACA